MVLQLAGNSKVDNLCDAGFRVVENILGIDIFMNDIVGMYLLSILTRAAPRSTFLVEALRDNS